MLKIIKTNLGQEILVDDEDFSILSRYTWRVKRNISGNLYAYRCINKNKKRTYFWLHQEIMNAPKGLVVDHIDNNGLNNQKKNLRICTRQQNSFNSKVKSKSSIFKGITSRANGKFIGQIVHNGKKIYLGIYNTDVDAARAYNAKAKELFGEFARTNEGV